MEKTSIDKKPFKDRTAHSNFRKGLADYNDGENVTHYLGNEDYTKGANLPSRDERENDQLNGKVAGGNELIENDEEEFQFNDGTTFDEGIDYE